MAMPEKDLIALEAAVADLQILYQELAGALAIMETGNPLQREQATKRFNYLVPIVRAASESLDAPLPSPPSAVEISALGIAVTSLLTRTGPHELQGAVAFLLASIRGLAPVTLTESQEAIVGSRIAQLVAGIKSDTASLKGAN